MLNWKCGTMSNRQLNLRDYFRQGPTSKTKQARIIIDTDSKNSSSPADDVNTKEHKGLLWRGCIWAAHFAKRLEAWVSKNRRG